MDDLVTWLRAQLDDDERVARLVAEHRLDSLIPAGIVDRSGATTYFTNEGYALIRRTLDPVRVLAEVDANRRILDLYEQTDFGDFARRTALEDVIRLRALPLAERPGYRDEWKP